MVIFIKSYRTKRILENDLAKSKLEDKLKKYRNVAFFPCQEGLITLGSFFFSFSIYGLFEYVWLDS